MGVRAGEHGVIICCRGHMDPSESLLSTMMMMMMPGTSSHRRVGSSSIPLGPGNMNAIPGAFSVSLVETRDLQGGAPGGCLSMNQWRRALRWSSLVYHICLEHPVARRSVMKRLSRANWRSLQRGHHRTWNTRPASMVFANSEYLRESWDITMQFLLSLQTAVSCLHPNTPLFLYLGFIEYPYYFLTTFPLNRKFAITSPPDVPPHEPTLGSPKAHPLLTIFPFNRSP